MDKNNLPEFSARCYDLLKKVPKGKVTTYQELAHALNCKAYRAVGNAMNKNPFAPEIPCHRVVRSNGALGGYAFGVKKKARMLSKEGIQVKNDKVVDLEQCIFRF